jgi:hypothetical protein
MLAQGEGHDFILLNVNFRMQSAPSPLWSNGHFYLQENQGVRLKNSKSCQKSDYIKEEPRSLKGVVERLARKTEKRLSISPLKRLAKKARLRWKRVRKAFKSLRDPEAFARCQRALAALQKHEEQGQIALSSVAERSFTLCDGAEMFVKPLAQSILRRSR